MFLSHFPLSSFKIKKGIPLFIAQLVTILKLIGTVLAIHGRIYLKLSACAVDTEFCRWVQVGTDVFVTNCKYQAKPHYMPWFSATYPASIAQRNYFCCLYQHSKFSASREKFRHSSEILVIVAKWFLKLSNLLMLIKPKSLLLPKNRGFEAFAELLIVFSTNVNLKYLLYLMDLRCSDKAKLFSKIFSKNSNLNESGIFLPVFPSRTNLKLKNIR